MTESNALRNYKQAFLPVRRFSCLVLLCSVFIISGCGYKPPGFSKLPFFNGKTDKAEKARQKLIKDKLKNGTSSPKNMFGRSLKNEKERLDRLERAVQDMRNEFDRVEPSITRLMGLESEIQTLIRELQQINEEGSLPVMTLEKPQPIIPKQMAAKPQTPAKPVKPIATSSPKSPKPSKKSYQKKTPPPVSNGRASIYDIRIGEHPNRTRIVMDSNAKTGFNVDIDNNEKIAVIDLPQAAWSAAKSKSLAKSNFVKSYSVESSGEGHILILQLKRNAKVTYKDDLKSTTDNSRRLVLDLSGS